MKKNEEYMEPYKGSDGRMKVKLIDKLGVEREEDLAQIVALSFQDICGSPKNSLLPMFKDGNSENCAADNLFWP
jgi:hypothetical protein